MREGDCPNKRIRFECTLASLPIHQHNGKIVLCLSGPLNSCLSSLPFDDFLDLLETVPRVDALHFDGDFWNGLSLDEQAKLFLMIGSFPSLKDVYISCAQVDAADLAFLLKMTTQLESFRLAHVELKGDQRDFDYFESGLYFHESLRWIAMRDFAVPDGISLDSLISTLSSIPNLQKVELHSRSIVEIRASSLRTLCRSQSLEQIHLSHLPVHPSNAAFMTRVFEETSVPMLRHLSLQHCRLDEQVATKLARLLSQKKSLEILDLSCNNLNKEGLVRVQEVLKQSGSHIEFQHSTSAATGLCATRGDCAAHVGDDCSAEYHPFFHYPATAA